MYEAILKASKSCCTTSLNDKNHQRINEWWDKETYKLHKELKTLEINSNSNAKTTIEIQNIKTARKNFERSRDANIRSIENEEFVKLNKLLKLNRKSFWRKLKKKTNNKNRSYSSDQ